MTERDWLAASDPEAMLALVEDRLSPRKWTLLATSFVRRLRELLPAGPLVEAIEYHETHAGKPLRSQTVQSWTKKIAKALPEAIEAARSAQHAAVATADPDTEASAYEEGTARKANPAVPLFRAASRAAQSAIDATVRSIEEAGEAIRSLFVGEGLGRLAEVRMRCVQALIAHAQSGIEATLALELKARADRHADRGPTKNVNLRQAEAIETANRLTESATNRVGELEEQKQKGDEKALGRFLLEQLGNPFRPYRFEPSWRTEEVVGIARAIHEDRHFDRFPILADALLDADCDEEAILRHCRGTEKHLTDPIHHAPGCWVIDRILELDEFFLLPPLEEQATPAPSERLGLAELGLLGLANWNLDDLEDEDGFPDEEIGEEDGSATS
jgi:hypothetical protein